MKSKVIGMSSPNTWKKKINKHLKELSRILILPTNVIVTTISLESYHFFLSNNKLDSIESGPDKKTYSKGDCNHLMFPSLFLSRFFDTF